MLIAGQSARDAQTLFYLLITSLYLSQNNIGRSGNSPRPDAMSGCIRDLICPLAHLYGRCSSLRASDQVTTFILAERRSQSNLLFSLAVTHCPPVPRTQSATLPAQPAPIPRSSPTPESTFSAGTMKTGGPRPRLACRLPGVGRPRPLPLRLGTTLARTLDYPPFSIPCRGSRAHPCDFWTSSRERGRLARTQRRTLETIRDSPRIWATPG